MGLIACPVKGKKKSVDICEAFVAGAPKGAAGLVFYGVDDSNRAAYAKAVKNRIPFYYIDNSYFDATRGTHFRVTRNALQIDAVEHTSDGLRFEDLGLRIKPMQTNPDGHFVLIEQSPSFMRDVGRPDWFHRTLLWAEATGRQVKVRRWSSDKPKLQSTLQADLEGAWRLITYSSAAAVTALLEGIPVIAELDSAVAHVRVSTDNSVDDRPHAMRVLADHQFTIEEMKGGLAWARVGS